MKTVDVVLPRLPPLTCGVADYALNLSESWPEKAAFRYWAAEGVDATREKFPGWSVEPVRPGAGGLAEDLIRAGSSELVVHYSAYGFDPKGWPRGLLRELGGWRKRSGGRMVVMLHELWGVWPWWSPQAWIQEMHRRDMVAWLRQADRVITNTPDHEKRLRACGIPACWWPVPSNIPLVDETIEPERGSLAVFGLPLARIRALEDHREMLLPAFRAGRLKKLLLLGMTAAGDLEEREKKALAGMVENGRVLRTGRLPAEELSRRLSGAEFALSDQTRLSLTKSTVFMAYAAHGMAVLSRFAEVQGEVPLGWMVHPQELIDGEEASWKERGRALRHWYEQLANWHGLARHFAGDFQEGVQR